MLGIAVEENDNGELKKNYLKKLFNMECIGAYCLTEPNSGSDALSIVFFIVKLDIIYFKIGN